jgi:hypothetical protein
MVPVRAGAAVASSTGRGEAARHPAPGSSLNFPDTPVTSGEVTAVGGVFPTGLNFPDTPVMSGKLEPAEQGAAASGVMGERSRGMAPPAGNLAR